MSVSQVELSPGFMEKKDNPPLPQLGLIRRLPNILLNLSLNPCRIRGAARTSAKREPPRSAETLCGVKDESGPNMAEFHLMPTPGALLPLLQNKNLNEMAKPPNLKGNG
jgi:hypothetical protein